MKYFLLVASIASFLNSAFAFYESQIGFAIGLLGGGLAFFALFGYE